MLDSHALKLPFHYGPINTQVFKKCFRTNASDNRQITKAQRVTDPCTSVIPVVQVSHYVCAAFANTTVNRILGKFIGQFCKFYSPAVFCYPSLRAFQSSMSI